MADPLVDLAQPLSPLLGPPAAPGFAPSVPAQAEFLMGVAMVDLYVAVREDREAEIERLRLEARSLLAGGGEEPRRIASGLEEGLSEDRVRQIDGRLEAVMGSEYRLGRWAEILRLAAEAESLDYLTSPATQAWTADAEPQFPASVRAALLRLTAASDPLERMDQLSALKRELRDWIGSRRVPK